MPLNTDENRMEKKKGGGCASLFGVPFLLVGLAVMTGPFLPGGFIEEMPVLFALPFGGIFAAVGGSLVFYRGGVVIDRAAGTITTWGGFLVRMWSKEYPLKDYQQVVLNSEVRRNKNSSYTVYPTRIAGPSVKAIDYFEDRVLQKARKNAELLAKFLKLPIHDSAEGQARVRAYETLDETVKDRFRKGEESNEIPPTPAPLKSRINYDGATLEVDIPPPGLKPPHFAAIGVAVVFELVVVFAFILPMIDGVSGQALWFVIPFLAIFSAIPLGIIGAIALPARFGRERLTVTRSGLEHWRGPFQRAPKRIPENQLEELFFSGIGSGRSSATASINALLGGGGLISARSDELSLKIGAGLGEAELRYILALAKATLVS